MFVQVNVSSQPADCGSSALILEQLKELQEALKLQPGCRNTSHKFALLASRINKAFFVFYVAVVSVFLLLIYAEWSS